MANRKGSFKRERFNESIEHEPYKKKACLPSSENGDKVDPPSDEFSVKPKVPWFLVSPEINRLMDMPQIQIHKLETLEACTHEVAVPPNVEYKALVASNGPPAKEYPFILDPFQKEALLCLENNQSVLVSAHTSAGKTVVAEYAIAMALNKEKKQRVIYTTPIKALSNQKYYEISEEFNDVGLMTGDVTINPDASCIIMTTEILRSMLYRGSAIMREVAWVIFDEIHYMRDKERGVVWEESIILLPDNIHYIFLSATIPNARQFAEWICYLHKQPCHVVYTDYRPTPLQHYIFPAGGDGIHLVVDENGNFRDDNFTTAMSVLRDSGDASKGDQRGRRGGLKGESNCFKLVKMIMEKDFAPVIVFSFSKKDCEQYARQMAKLNFSSTDEEKAVDLVFTNAIDYTLSDEEKDLPQVKEILPLLRKGIGIHHSGLLPVIKETVEILFSEGLIKALFATETFSMGLNMPARTVLFTSTRKYDGKDFRWISSGEYIQMSGRAGRRGKDDKGIVILMVDEKMSPGIGKDIIKGKSDPLNSAFRLTYSMVLNLLRMEEINPEYMLEKSFYQFQNFTEIRQLITKLQDLDEKRKSIMIENEEEVLSYHQEHDRLNRFRKKVSSFINKPKYILGFLKPGRLVKVVNNAEDLSWCVVVHVPQICKESKSRTEASFDILTDVSKFFWVKKTEKSSETQQKTNTTCDPIYTVDVMTNVLRGNPDNSQISLMMNPDEKNKWGKIISIELNEIIDISAIRIVLPQDINSLDSKLKVYKALEVLEKKFPTGVVLMDPIKDMLIEDNELKRVIKCIEECKKCLKDHLIHTDAHLQESSKLYESKLKMDGEMRAVKLELQQHPYFLQMDELKRRKRILRRLGYAKIGDVVEMKGRMACEITSGDELLLTELLFNGVFNSLTAEEICSLLSCFIFQENSSETPQLTEELSKILRQLQEAARRIAKVTIDANLPIDEDKYVESFRPDMMNVVNAWCKGSSFGQICQMTEIYEGSIIRCMRRLQETLLQMYQASKGIGNADLEIKFCKGISLIKRNIVNACSLYIPKY